jgi:hypothetical protein
MSSNSSNDRWAAGVVYWMIQKLQCERGGGRRGHSTYAILAYTCICFMSICTHIDLEIWVSICTHIDTKQKNV